MAVRRGRVFLSVVTLAELRHGIERMPMGRRRNRLDQWLSHELSLRFEGRLLPFDAEAADSWGRIMARAEAAGRPPGNLDAMIAAIAGTRGLTIVTRNVSDFEILRTPTLNPWTHPE